MWSSVELLFRIESTKWTCSNRRMGILQQYIHYYYYKCSAQHIIYKAQGVCVCVCVQCVCQTHNIDHVFSEWWTRLLLISAKQNTKLSQPSKPTPTPLPPLSSLRLGRVLLLLVLLLLFFGHLSFFLLLHVLVSLILAVSLVGTRRDERR